MTEILSNTIHSITKDSHTDWPTTHWGIAVLDQAGTSTYELNGRQEMLAADLNQLGVTHALEHSRLSLDKTLVLQPSDITPGKGILQHFPEGYELTLRDTARLALSHSDQTATRALVRTLGGPLEVNDILSESPLDLLHSYLRSDSDDPAAPYSNGNTNPRESSRLFLSNLQHPVFGDALRHSDFTGGLRKDIEPNLRTDILFQSERDEYIGLIETLEHHPIHLVPDYLYDRLLKLEAPETAFPNKASEVTSDNARYHYRHDIAFIGGQVISAMTMSLSQETMPKEAHHTRLSQAKLGAAMLQYAA